VKTLAEEVREALGRDFQRFTSWKNIVPVPKQQTATSQHNLTSASSNKHTASQNNFFFYPLTTKSRSITP